jgi:hypothetical protein
LQAERFVPSVFSSSSSSNSSSSMPNLLDSATALTDKHQHQHMALQRQQQRLQQLLSQHRHVDNAGAANTAAAAPHAIVSSSSVQIEQLPDLLKSHRSGVGMSLILRAARDVPLHLLSEEYEKVRSNVL